MPPRIKGTDSREERTCGRRVAHKQILSSPEKNHAEGGGGAAASFAASTSVTSDTSTPMASATGSSSMTTTAQAETETTPKKPLAAEQPTEAAAALSYDPSPALHMQSSSSSSSQRSTVSPPIATSSAAAPTATPSSVSSANNPTTNADADVTDTVTSTRTPTRFSKLWPSETFFHTATNVIQKGLIRSKDATTAFLYRTFSPTYRISRLYVDSWGNGSQRRGLERIKNGFIHGDAFTLVKITAGRMKDVWNQVMAAYRVKSSATALARKKDNNQSIGDSSKAEKPSPVSNCSGDNGGSNGSNGKQDDSNGGGSKTRP
ncbi:hypothetical protein BGZ58_006858 [Dissophora ornata]|nr:hypothetical protein BGZ58_006858 [Dissophora ornata]